ncbi:hypothetical protein [Kitasatospora sp. McL0602]|uniref:hypothetical protein n=1 Tax=Kitasatospora sp. McL0602 TaxID=3439530 RepID=UPI003F8C78E9
MTTSHAGAEIRCRSGTPPGLPVRPPWSPSHALSVRQDGSLGIDREATGKPGAVLAGLTPAEHSVAMAWAHPSTGTWAEAASLAGQRSPEANGVLVRVLGAPACTAVLGRG